MRDGDRSECKTCHQAQQRRWYQANRRAAIASVKRWQQAPARLPQGVSATAEGRGSERVLRGLLCVGCNNALGQFRDNVELLSRATSYLLGDLLTMEYTGELSVLAQARAGELRRTSV